MLGKQIVSERNIVIHNRQLTLICICWVAGLISGCLITVPSEPDASGAIFSLVQSRPSLLQLCGLRLLPVIALALCVKLRPVALFVIWGKGMLFGFCLSDIARTFSTAGWLVQSLLLFSDFVAIVVFLWFGIRNIGSKKQTMYFDAIFCLNSVSIACVIDYKAVSPYLMMLLDS